MKEIVQLKNNERFDEKDFSGFMQEVARKPAKLQEERRSIFKWDTFMNSQVESKTDNRLNIFNKKYTKHFQLLAKSQRSGGASNGHKSIKTKIEEPDSHICLNPHL